jgi:hypothetical protein
MWNVAGHMPTREGHFAIERQHRNADIHAHLVEAVLSPTRVRVRHAVHEGLKIIVWDEEQKRWKDEAKADACRHYVFGASTDERLVDL